MAWCRPVDKPLSEPTMVNLLTHICVTRPQWINSSWPSDVTWYLWAGPSLFQIMAAASSAPNHYLNQCCRLMNQTRRNKIHWNYNHNIRISFQENANRPQPPWQCHSLSFLIFKISRNNELMGGAMEVRNLTDLSNLKRGCCRVLAQLLWRPWRVNGGKPQYSSPLRLWIAGGVFGVARGVVFAPGGSVVPNTPVQLWTIPPPLGANQLAHSRL